MADLPKMTRHTVGGLGIAAIAVVGIHAQVPDQYVSPDGKTVAIVETMAGPKANESNVGIFEVSVAGTSSTPRRNQSFVSIDGEHGLIVVRSAWSPNSNYFVFSGKSSGGHQPWHSPLFVYSRRTNRLFKLDTCLPRIAVVAPEFDLSSPHFARVTVDDFVGDVGLARNPRSETYDLAAVERSCRGK